MKRFLLAGAATAVLASAAFAADPAAEPVDVWNGYFVGLQAGYASGELNYEVPLGPSSGTLDLEGAVGGFYLGRNWQLDDVVLGLESSLSFADPSVVIPAGLGIASGDFGIQAFSTSRVKVGYAFDNLLVYGAAGISVARFDATRAPPADEQDEWAFGWTAGAGAEMKISESWSVRVEYLYIDYDTKTMFDPAAAVTYDVNDLNLVRGGVAYNF
jgi:outer membrane immunogenic protein